MKAFIRLWKKPAVTVEVHELTVHEGARILVDGEYCQFLIVVTEKDVFHPVVDLEVM